MFTHNSDQMEKIYAILAACPQSDLDLTRRKYTNETDSKLSSIQFPLVQFGSTWITITFAINVKTTKRKHDISWSESRA